MPVSNSHFVWCELMTTDASAAAVFYRDVVGWRTEEAGIADRHYLILHAGDTPMGGIVDLPAPARAAGARPSWIGYIGVDDVDAYVARVCRAGGSVHRGAEDVPGVGRFAIVADPQGADFTLFTLLQGQAPPLAAATPGRVGWHELRATDQESAFAFYADLFGWKKTEAIDMGGMGIYQTFATGGPTGAAMVGGMMTKTDPSAPASWMYYFNVDSTEAAVARTKKAGGQLCNGPMQVPGGSWIAQCQDAQGAPFAVVGPDTGG